MTEETRSEQERQGTEVPASESSLVDATGATLPVAPPNLPDEDAEQLRVEAAQLVRQLGAAAGSREMELLDNISGVGAQSQRTAASQLDLLKARMGTFLGDGGTGKQIAEGLRDLRNALKEITPDNEGRPGFVGRAISAIPVVGKRYNPVVRTLNRIAIRYEPVSQQVTVIETRLMDGRALLVRDNLELRRLYEDVEAQQLQIQRQAYLGELLMQEIAQLVQQTDDPIRRDRLQGALHDVAMRVQDLRTMEEVHLQYFVSIEMGRQNNNRLGQSVERTVALATNVVTVGLAIQSALVRQKKVQEATTRTREFLGELVAANAQSIRTHTEEVGDLYNNPVIAVEKIAQAHNDLVEALDIASRLRQEGVEAARHNIARLGEMARDMETRVGGMPAEETGGPKAIES